MISTIVVDDEWYILEEISGLVEETGFMSVIGKYQNPLKVLEATMPQVAFIDIEMPEMDGITLAEKLLEINPEIIIVFITSWNHYAVKAFDLNALDYIMKPIKRERFSRMIYKIRDEVSLKVMPASNTLKIKCFDRLQISISGGTVKLERAKTEELFAFLLVYHGEFIHKETIIENLWTDYEMTKALPILQTSICKIRKVFSQLGDKFKLEYSGNSYCLTISNVECDLFDLEKILAASRSKKGGLPDLDELEAACAIYGNGFLTGQGYFWSMQKDAEIHQSLLRLLKKAAGACTKETNDMYLQRILKLMTSMMPEDEEYHDPQRFKKIKEKIKKIF
jgi:two-component SAPR family response regulator